MTRSLSLRARLTGLVAAGSVVTAIAAVAGFSWQDLRRYREHTATEVSAVADIVADQAGAAVMLGDYKSATEILVSLRTDARIREATIYDAAGRCFAAFRRDPATVCEPRPNDGIAQYSDALVVARSVLSGDERVGTLALVVDTAPVARFLRQYLSGAVVIMILSIAVAAAFGLILESRVATPILAIAGAARRIAEVHSFDQRVPVVSTDEVGVLARSFNAMVDEIARRDSELLDHRNRLELEVAERIRINEDLLRARDSAEEATRLKSEFLANMSHEIRTPLNGVSGMIGLALENCSGAEQCEYLEAAQAAARSLATILNDILDFSKIEAGKMTVESIDFDLVEIARASLLLFELSGREKALDLVCTISPDCPSRVTGDPVRVRQILVNLIGNAVKFTVSGSVQVRVTAGDGNIRFVVADTGIGIPEEKLTSIFEPFTQADGSHTRRFGGTGLGLTITRRLVDLMNGRLWAESEPGKGSRFFVELPLRASRTRTPAEPTAPVAEAPPARSLNILVAEDNLINQKVVSSLLKRQGWTVTMTADGAQAYSRFCEQRFDLLLLDVQMPEVDGLEATSLIRAEEQRRGTPRTPVIAVTAHASRAHHDQCMAAGMDGVITKPIDVAALRSIIAAVLEAARRPATV